MRYAWLVSLSAGMGGFLFGYEVGLIGQVLGMTSFLRDFDMAVLENGVWTNSENYTNYSSWITSSFLFGCVLGAGIFSVAADYLGRKYSILIGGCTFFAGGIMQAASSSFALLLSGRAVSGVAIGTVSMVVPLYIAETAPPNSRGALTSVYQLMITFGIFVATCINSIFIKTIDNSSSVEWRVALAIQVVPAVVLVSTVVFIPRSPRWLCERGYHSEGLDVIAKLRGTSIHDPAVIAEYDDIQDNIEFERTIGDSSWRELFVKNYRRAIVGIMNQTFQQLTGVNEILYYSSSIFSQMGFEHADTVIAFPLANAFINFISTFPGMWAVDRFGRRPLLQWGGLIMGIAHALVFAFLTAANNTDHSLAWGAIVAIFVFVIAFSSTWGPVVWSYQAEIYPLRIRAKGIGLSTMTNWAWNAVIAWGFPHVYAALNYEPTVYCIFSAFCFLMAAWAAFFVPETRGLTLEEIDGLFGEELARQRRVVPKI
ncbi:hypothetical protein HDU83_004263 [Entophlyctis luteolus]|nr:hypothetical protein HDU83_004263 [Entophlyctis luteolus]KAJ3382639.1 hypothetical protein HDU84_004177 [Entophlyctis sp. JEL0112]